MGKKTSGYVPQHPQWYEYLPARDAPLDRAPKMVHGDINEMGDGFLEISRASTLTRGPGLVFGLLGTLGFSWALIFLLIIIFPIDEETLPFAFMWPFALLLGIHSVLLCLKTDLTIPGSTYSL